MAGFGHRAATSVAKVQFKAMDAMRSKKAFDVAGTPPTATDFREFERARQCVLVTYKRSGDAVPSPINHGVADGKLYVRTDAGTAKVKRLRNNPRALLVPSGLRGTPKGAAIAATARILTDPSDIAVAERAIEPNWSKPMKLLEDGLSWGANKFELPLAYIEFTPTSSAPGSGAGITPN